MQKNRNEYQTEYKRNNYKRVPLDLPKEKYQQIKTHAESRAESVNGFIKRAIDETIENDNSK